MPRNARLRKSADFRAVYGGGRRIEGRLMTVFILSNDLDLHRMGITASRKMGRRAVDRNRAKRLLREAFRLSAVELDILKTKYDWVFNARRRIVEVKLNAVTEELRRVIAQVMDEKFDSIGRADT
ncbi:MAG TPA: ribonuclease P protein component [Pyrinomonadaceae bacterium]|nr:ribonuclease P protein component [Pyrinomonadaceae bacterium]